MDSPQTIQNVHSKCQISNDFRAYVTRFQVLNSTVILNYLWRAKKTVVFGIQHADHFKITSAHKFTFQHHKTNELFQTLQVIFEINVRI